MILYIVDANKTITLFTSKGGTPVPVTHANYKKIKEGLMTGQKEDYFDKLLAPKTFISDFAKGKVTVQDGVFFFNGKELHGSLVERISSLMQDGFPFEPMLKFLENIQQNPSMRSREELYDFLSNRGLPITEDGHFLAYKAVDVDFLDKYSRKHLNTVGSVLEMPRSDVDDDRARECSYGYHVGCLQYAREYGGTNCVMLIVKVNPKDCVSVPRDHSFQKLRVCKYQVLRVHSDCRNDEQTELPGILYNEEGQQCVSETLEKKAINYEEWTRDALVEECYARKLYQTKEAARRDKKVGMIRQLQNDDNLTWYECDLYSEED